MGDRNDDDDNDRMILFKTLNDNDNSRKSGRYTAQPGQRQGPWTRAASRKRQRRGVSAPDPPKKCRRGMIRRDRNAALEAQAILGIMQRWKEVLEHVESGRAFPPGLFPPDAFEGTEEVKDDHQWRTTGRANKMDTVQGDPLPVDSCLPSEEEADTLDPEWIQGMRQAEAEQAEQCWGYWKTSRTSLGAMMQRSGETPADGKLTDDDLEDYEVPRATGITGDLRERLIRHHLFWRFIRSSKRAIKIVMEGARIPFGRKKPKRFALKNYFTTDDTRSWGGVGYVDFVRQCIREYLQHGVIRMWDTEKEGWPMGISPIQCVPKSTLGKLRFIHDLSFLNQWCNRRSFAMNTLQRYRWIFTKNAAVISADLTQGYHHVRMAREDQTWLCFQFEGVIYTFEVVAFGGTASPELFTHMVGQPVKFLRGRTEQHRWGWHHDMIHYIDDLILNLVRDGTEGLRRRFFIWTLRQAGFLVNESKSDLSLSCVLEAALGFKICTERFLFISQDKKLDVIENLAQKMAEDIENRKPISARAVAVLVGKVCSQSLTAEEVAAIFTRHLQVAIAGRDEPLRHRSWDTRIDHLLRTEGVKKALSFLANEGFRECCTTPISGTPVLFVRFPVTASTDGSETGTGGWIRILDRDGKVWFECKTARDWAWESRKLSSHTRELVGADEIVKVLIEAVQHAREAGVLPKGEWVDVRIRMDSQSSTQVLTKGRSKSNIEDHDIVTKILMTLRGEGIRANFKWVRRNRNWGADELSNYVERADYSLLANAREKLLRDWGACTFDACADPSNIIPGAATFMSLFHHVGSLGDALADPWPEGRAWVFPPPSIATQVWTEMVTQRREGIFIVPKNVRGPWAEATCITKRRTVHQSQIRHGPHTAQPRSAFLALSVLYTRPT